MAYSNIGINQLMFKSSVTTLYSTFENIHYRLCWVIKTTHTELDTGVQTDLPVSLARLEKLTIQQQVAAVVLEFSSQVEGASQQADTAFQRVEEEWEVLPLVERVQERETAAGQNPEEYQSPATQTTNNRHD